MKRHDHEQPVSGAKTVKKQGDWQLSVSKDKKTLYIKALSYHAPALKLSQEDLKELMEKLKS